MPIPFILGAIAAVTAVTGVSKAIDASDTNKRARHINAEAEKVFDKAKRNLLNSKNQAAASLTQLGQEKVDVLQKDMMPFVKLMRKIKNVDMTEIQGMGELSKLQVSKDSLVAMEDMGSLAVNMATGIAEGTAGGALLALGAYGAVGYLGTAGTGAAIAGLSGAAATNATLAFLGGGTLAAGGFGVAGGMAVLGGLVAGPALAVLGFAMNSKANENLENAKSNRAKAKKAAAEMNLASDGCQAISERADMFTQLLGNVDDRFHTLVVRMQDILSKNGTNYSSYGQEEKNVLAMAWSLAVATKTILDTPILNKDGAVTTDSENVYQEISSKVLRIEA